MDECIGFIGWLRGHNFEPIFTNLPMEKQEMPPGSDGTFIDRDLIDLYRVMAGERFEGSICTRCGAAASLGKGRTQ